MADFLSQLGFNQFSFWLGFLAGSLFWFLISGLRGLIPRLRKRFQIQAELARSQVLRVDEIRLGNDTLRRAQAWHLAAPLFSLEEIVIEPKLLSPPIPPGYGEDTMTTDITDWAIPYLPDWPELASHYSAPSLSLAQALEGGSNLAIIGQPGVGKSVALAYLATQIIRGDPQVGELVDWVPILLHAAELLIPEDELEDPQAVVYDAVLRYASPQTAARLPNIFANIFESGRALLLLDGLDELSPVQLDKVVLYLNSLLKQYPHLRIVASASSDYLGGLPALGLFPIPLALWNDNQREQFILRWNELWVNLIDPMMVEQSEPQMIHPLMLNGWLIAYAAHLTPLELTLKVWAAFAGDALGPGPVEALETYLRRMTHKQPSKNLPALEQLALRVTQFMQPIAIQKDVEAWLSGSTSPPSVEVIELVSEQGESLPEELPSRKERVRAPGALPDFIESSLIKAYPAGRFGIAHPVITGYLAGSRLARSGDGHPIIAQPDWVGKSQALYHLAILEGQIDLLISGWGDETDDPLMRDWLTAARWLRGTPHDKPWVSTVMRKLAASMNRESLPMGVKARALTALVISEAPGISVLMHKMLSSPQSDLRHLACLGCGVLRDTEFVGKISDLISDSSPQVSRAAILALVSIANKQALEEIAHALLHGDESLQKAAAEALANHPEEGHPTLEEGSQVSNPAVRRAAVFGLARVQQPWAIEILEKLRAEDEQWLVQDAANQALMAYEGMNPHIPRPQMPLNQTPWLVSFAAERGMGVSPGKPAFDLLYQLLEEGTEEERLAAVYYLGQRGDPDSVRPLYQVLYSSRREVQEAALISLWYLSAAGVELPKIPVSQALTV